MASSALGHEKCQPSAPGTPPLSAREVVELLRHLHGWEVVDDRKLRKPYKFPNFATALEFVNGVGALAEREGHHPDIQLSWGRVVIEIWTHSIGGLSRSDFVLAAKLDELGK